MAKFKVGDIVIIKDNIHGHGFKIGELVRVVELDEDEEVLMAEKLDGSDYWCVEDKELKKPTKNELLKISKTLIEGL